MTGAPQRDDEHTPDDPPRRSIAVLPFTDLSVEKDQAHFCDGIAEKIINDLSRLGGLRVVSRTSSFALKGKSLDEQEVGSKLGVDTLVAGSVQKSNGRLRISAELVNVSDGKRIWSQRFDREMTEIFAIQGEIAHRIAEALQLRLSDHQRRAIGKATTRDVEAYEFYLRGRQFFFRSSRKGVSSAVEMFDRAIRKDPSYALAYAGLADCYAYLFMYFDPDVNNLKFARNASTHALSLDQELAEAHAARGLAVSLSKRYEEAEAAFEEAIRREPSLFEAHYFYARTCFAQGKYEQACRLYETASQVNPDDAQALGLLAFTYRAMGEDERADHTSRQALLRLERHLDLNPDDPRAMYLAADALVQTGESEKAIRWAERAVSLDPEDPYALYGLACIYSRVGEIDKAVTTLEMAVDCGFGHKEWVVNDSDFDPLRDHPRFQALLEKLDEPQQEAG